MQSLLSPPWYLPCIAIVWLSTLSSSRSLGAHASPATRAEAQGAQPAERSGESNGAKPNVHYDPVASQSQQRIRSGSGQIYKATIVPHWFAENTCFWYRNDLPEGKREFVLVDALKGTRRPAFDHQRLAQSLQQNGLPDCRADRLPIDWIQFDRTGAYCVFRMRGRNYRCNLTDYAIQTRDVAISGDDQGCKPLTPENVPRMSRRTGLETTVTFVNRTDGELQLMWLDTDGQLRSYGSLAAGQQRTQHTFEGHIWKVLDTDRNVLAVFEASEFPARAIVTGKAAAYDNRPPGRRRNRRPAPSGLSPDKQWSAVVKDNNVCLQSAENDAEIQLGSDGTADEPYDMLQWSPDSKTLVAYRVKPGDNKEVYLIESSPKGGGRAKLLTRPYALPGDRFPAYELNLFDVPSHKQTKPTVDRIDFGQPRLRWNSDGHRFTYQQVDRGHQRFRLIEVDCQTKKARNVIDERSKTFIWTAHTDSLQLPLISWIGDTDELIYVFERDGWRHLYLVDSRSGTIINQITKGPYVVRGIDRIDEDERQIWFRASGMNAGQDPYLIQYYRVNFDGTGLVALTEANGYHSIQYSPDRRFLIDRYSRIDLPPRHELRRTSDGQLICQLEQADVSELRASGWHEPEVFVAKGRDGKTDIWGIICRPRTIDPNKKYPILEDIYAGPHGAFVPKTFSRSQRYAELTELGFIVVKIDGMGTAFRSKAFHDVCWKNLKDAGLPDRILWIKAAAKKYPYMDIDRVGIYGTSAGGQSAAAAVLFHSDFYKAAAAFCGCHDNRMDKASWNEQWMGYPVGPQYAECSNIENAHRLGGRLLLMVGELDTNVPPESTMRFVDALIKAGKDFELLVVPGAGHGNGGKYGQRRMRDFFVRHLLGRETPDRNQAVQRSQR